nr:MAG TPA: tail tape measure protein [Caudoviricetes sp.]
MAKTQEVVYKIKVLDVASGKLKELKVSMEGVGKKAKQTDNELHKLGKRLKWLINGGITATTIGVVGGAIFGVGKAAVSAAAQIEKYNATLETMLGSKSAARDRMQEYMRIAKTTPFELTEVVEAGNQLQALGRYSEDTLTMLGDLAAASGKPFEQVMGAYAKMASGQKGIAVDMFRDLLITTDDWAKATGKGKAASGEMLATTEELLQALPKVMKSKGFFGLMAKQSETTEGKIANLEDALFSLRSSVGERLTPTVKGVVGAMEGWVSSMDRAIRIPIEQKIAAEQAQLNILVERLIDTNDNEEQRRSIIGELQRDYPEFLQNIDAERASTEELRAALKAANGEYERKIRLAVYSQKMEELQEEAADAMSTIADVEIGNRAAEKVKELEARRHELLGAIGWGKDDKYGYYRTENGKRVYLNAANQKEVTQIDAQLAANRKLVSKRATWYGGRKDADAAKQKLEETKAQMSTMEELIDGEQSTMDAATSSAPAPSSSSSAVAAGGGTTGGTRASGTTIGGSGGGGGRNVTTNIGTLVGKLEIHTTTLKQSAAEIKALMTQILTEAVSEI